MKKKLRRTVHNDPELAHLAECIRALQGELRQEFPKAAWEIYLKIEELSNARLVRVEDLCLELLTSEVAGPDEEE